MMGREALTPWIRGGRPATRLLYFHPARARIERFRHSPHDRDNARPRDSSVAMNSDPSSTEREPLARHDFTRGDVDAALEFLKRTRSELRMLRRVRVWTDQFRVYDINGDCFEIAGVGYPDSEIVAILNAVNTNYKPQQIHDPAPGPYKEFKTGRRYPWAADRVM